MKKQFSIPAAIAAAMFGLGVSGTASALPEVEVGSRLLAGTSGNAQTQGAEPADAVAADEDSTAADGAQPTTN